MKNKTEYLDDDEICKDGESIRVPIMAMDAAVQRAIAGVDLSDHQPGYRRVADAAAEQRRREARAEYVTRLVDAWKTPNRIVDAAEPDLGSRPEELRRHLRTEPDDDAQARRDAAWTAYRDRLSRAWQTNPGAANVVERQREQWTHER